jgi:hypothetical protein
MCSRRRSSVQRRAERDVPLLSLMFDVVHQPRRRRFIESAHAAGLPLRNVRDVFEPQALKRLYDRTRVLVNVHQTDHHDTLEELRILPALLRGVVIVSEDVPRREDVPYHRWIVWCDYDAIVATTQKVLADYHAWYARLFKIGDPALAQTLAQMARDNRDEADTAVRRMLDGA